MSSPPPPPPARDASALKSRLQVPPKPLLIHGPVKQHWTLRDLLFCLSHITQSVDIIIVMCLKHRWDYVVRGYWRRSLRHH
jgi:hypothetical protein